MKNYEELMDEVKIPTRYGMDMSDAFELKEWIENEGSNGIFNAITYAYTLGFKKGKNYEKNRMKNIAKKKG